MVSAEGVGQVLTKLKWKIPRREGTKQWNLQTMNGAFKICTSQMCRHGNGDGWNSSHGERMNQYFFTRLGHSLSSLSLSALFLSSTL